jgi:hypothetical protein
MLGRRFEPKAPTDFPDEADFLVQYYKEHPVDSADPKSIEFPQPLLKELIRWATFLTRARAELKWDDGAKDSVPIAANPPEAPFKVVTYFKDIACGNALVNGRSKVNRSDIDLIGEVAISSIPGHLRPIIRELRRTDVVETDRVVKLCRVTAPTARNYLRELALLGIAELDKGSSGGGTSDHIVLSTKYEWLKRHAER